MINLPYLIDHRYPLLYYYEYNVCYTMYNCIRVDYRLTHPGSLLATPLTGTIKASWTCKGDFSWTCPTYIVEYLGNCRDINVGLKSTTKHKRMADFWILTFWDGVPRTCSWLFFNFVQVCYLVKILNYFDGNKKFAKH